MIRKKILVPDRVRQIEGGFGFIPHRFFTDGFLAALSQHELLLYLLLILAADRYGLSFYSSNAICSLLGLTANQYINTRDSLIKNDLIAYDGTIFQVLSLPAKPIRVAITDAPRRRDRGKSPESVGQILKNAFKELSNG